MMTKESVIRVEGKNGAFKLLYSHDDGYTRHVVEFLPDGYCCRLNEIACFKRGTHEKMARLHGIDLNALPCVTFREASYGL